MSHDALGKEFDEMCGQRLDQGARTYGPTAFVTADTIQMMLEELVDIVNYCRFTYIKMRLFQEEVIEMEKEVYPLHVIRPDSSDPDDGPDPSG